MKIYNFFMILFVFGLIWSCSKDKTSGDIFPFDCDETISFSEEVLPLISSNCSTSGCHSAASGAAGYIFTNYDNIFENKNIMLKTMRHESGVTPMPLGQTQLSSEQIGIMDCWIEQGAMNN